MVPFVLLLILGVLDFGRAYNLQNDETHMANEAVRYAAVDACSACTTNSQTIDQYVQSQGVNGVTVSFCFPNGATQYTQGNPVKATATARGLM